MDCTTYCNVYGSITLENSSAFLDQLRRILIKKMMLKEIPYVSPDQVRSWSFEKVISAIMVYYVGEITILNCRSSESGNYAVEFCFDSSFDEEDWDSMFSFLLPVTVAGSIDFSDYSNGIMWRQVFDGNKWTRQEPIIVYGTPEDCDILECAYNDHGTCKISYVRGGTAQKVDDTCLSKILPAS